MVFGLRVLWLAVFVFPRFDVAITKKRSPWMAVRAELPTMEGVADMCSCRMSERPYHWAA